MFEQKKRAQVERHHQELKEQGYQRSRALNVHNEQMEAFREREIKEQELENQRIKTLEHKIIEENKELIREIDSYESYFDFIKSALVDTEVFTDLRFVQDWNSELELEIDFKGDHDERGTIRITKKFLTLILMQKLGRDVMRPFGYAKAVISDFFKIESISRDGDRPIHPKFKEIDE